jgi:hypothetical protein
LVAPGDRVKIAYKLESRIKSPTGSLYVRNDLQRRFARLPMRLKGNPMKGGSTFWAVVRRRLLRGRKLFYYAVVRDPKSGRSVKVPARAPEFAWILEKPVVVRLGAHRFGHIRAPEAVVARARADEVGWDIGPEFNLGPQTFLVGHDRSIWLEDEFNHRMLVWRADRPDATERSVALPPGGLGDIALGPTGTLYAYRPGTPDYPANVLYRLSATGEVLWQHRLPDRFLGWNAQLRVGPNGTLYFVVSSADFGRPAGEYGWMPMATPSGRPLSTAAQRRGILWGYQPLADGLRLVSEMYTRRIDTPSHEARLGLIDRSGRLVRGWRIHSRTQLFFPAGYTTPELVAGDPVVVLDLQAGAYTSQFKWERMVLRLAPGGTRARFSLSKPAVYGDNLFADLRVGPDGKLYQLATSPTTGVVISRYSLDPNHA